MSQEELKEVLKEFKTVRVEMLDDNARRLFYAIMKIADERDELLKENQRLNNVLNELEKLWKEQQKYYRYHKDNRYRSFLSKNLDKLNELKESDK